MFPQPPLSYGIYLTGIFLKLTIVIACLKKRYYNVQHKRDDAIRLYKEFRDKETAKKQQEKLKNCYKGFS